MSAVLIGDNHSNVPSCADGVAKTPASSTYRNSLFPEDELDDCQLISDFLTKKETKDYMYTAAVEYSRCSYSLESPLPEKKGDPAPTFTDCRHYGGSYDKPSCCRCKTDICQKECFKNCHTLFVQNVFVALGLHVRESPANAHVRHVPNLVPTEGLPLCTREVYNRGCERHGCNNSQTKRSYVLKGIIPDTILTASFDLYVNDQIWKTTKRCYKSGISIIMTGSNDRYQSWMAYAVNGRVLQRMARSLVRDSENTDIKRQISERYVYILYQVFRTAVATFRDSMFGMKDVYEQDLNNIRRDRFADNPSVMTTYLFLQGDLDDVLENLIRCVFINVLKYHQVKDVGTVHPATLMKHFTVHGLSTLREICLMLTIYRTLLSDYSKGTSHVEKIDYAINWYDDHDGYIPERLSQMVVRRCKKIVEISTLEEMLQFLGWPATRTNMLIMVSSAVDAYLKASYPRATKSRTTRVESQLKFVSLKDYNAQLDRHKNWPKHMMRKTCGYCDEMFSSRRKLFTHLSEMHVSTDCDADVEHVQKHYTRVTREGSSYFVRND